MRRLYDFIMEEVRRGDLLLELKKYEIEKARKAPSVSSLLKGGQNTSDKDLKDLYEKFKKQDPSALLKSVMGQSTLSDIGGSRTGHFNDPDWVEVLYTAFAKMDNMNNDHFAKLLRGEPEFIIGQNKKPGIFIPMNPEWRTGVVGKENVSMKLCAYWCKDLVEAMFRQGFFGSTSANVERQLIKQLKYGKSNAKDGVYILKGNIGSFGGSGD